MNVTNVLLVVLEAAMDLLGLKKELATNDEIS